MSRSYRYTPIVGIASSKGQKLFRTIENKKYRRLVHALVSVELYDDLPDERAFGDEWKSPRDGKQWVTGELIYDPKSGFHNQTEDENLINKAKWMRK